MVSNLGPGKIISWAYENLPATSIVTGIVPEPATFTLFATRRRSDRSTSPLARPHPPPHSRLFFIIPLFNISRNSFNLSPLTLYGYLTHRLRNLVRWTLHALRRSHHRRTLHQRHPPRLSPRHPYFHDRRCLRQRRRRFPPRTRSLRSSARFLCPRRDDRPRLHQRPTRWLQRFSTLHPPPAPLLRRLRQLHPPSHRSLARPLPGRSLRLPDAPQPRRHRLHQRCRLERHG